MIETINNLDPIVIVKNEQIRHSTAAKRNMTKIRNKYRDEDIKIIAKHFPEIKSVLCVGCRDDSEVRHFIKNGVGCIGIDVSNETKYIKRIDAHKLNEHFNHFDLIYSSHSLEHMYNPNKVLSNIRNLKPIGVYIVLPLQKKPLTLKHPSKFEIMKIENQGDSIEDIIAKKKDIFENPKDHQNVWGDFNSLKPFTILDWIFRDGINPREKEVAFLLKLKWLEI